MEEKDIDKNKKVDEPTEENKEPEVEEEKVSKKAFDGIRSELIQTRQDRQILANQLSESQQKVREFENRLRELEAKKGAQELNAVLGEDDDEPVTGKQLKKAYIALQEAEAKKKQIELIQAQRDNFAASVNKMRLETQDKAKYGLDWDTLSPVINRIYAENNFANRAWEQYILGTSNPAKVLYEMALKEPDVQERAKIIENGKVLNSMETRKTDKNAVDGSSSSAPAKKLTLADVARMTPAETRKHMKEIDELLKANKGKK